MPIKRETSPESAAFGSGKRGPVKTGQVQLPQAKRMSALLTLFCGAVLLSAPGATASDPKQPLRLPNIADATVGKSAQSQMSDNNRRALMDANTEQASLFPFFSKQNTKSDTKLSRATVEAVIKAPREFVWDNLTDFNHYPRLFPRVKSSRVLKQDDKTVYLETDLKPQMFVKQTCQHTINEIGAKPELLRWNMVDGTFKSATGEWKLTPMSDGRCQVSYTLEIDPGPAIPRPVASLALKVVQKEIVQGVKQVIEQDYARRTKQATR